MKSVARLSRTIRMAEDLASLVGTMKTLAAVNIRQFENAASAIHDYVRNVESGLQVLLMREPRFLASAEHGAGNAALVVFGSDQGLCGSFNERVVATSEKLMRAEEPAVVLVTGHRTARRLAEHDPELHEYRTPSTVAAIAAHVGRILVQLGNWLDDRSLGRVVVVHNRNHGVGGFRPSGDAPDAGAGYATVTTPLLPLDPDWLRQLATRPWESRALPDFRAAPNDLFYWLVQEWLYARLYQCCAESVAAENAARLLATQSAARSIDDRLQTLRARHRRERQRAITEELLDLYR